MSENAISSGIVSTASIITTIIIVAATFTVAGLVGNALRINGENLADQINTDFSVIGQGDIHSGNTTIKFYLKNTGEQSVKSYNVIDVNLDGEYYYYLNLDTTKHRWNITIMSDFNNNELWDVQETTCITLTFPTGLNISAGSHKLMVSINGVSKQYQFSI